MMRLQKQILVQDWQPQQFTDSPLLIVSSSLLEHNIPPQPLSSC